MTEDALEVTFTVKEMFAQINETMTKGFARVEVRLDSKADKADVEKVQTQLTGIANRLESVEDWRRDQESAGRLKERSTDRRQRVWNYSIGVLAIVGTIGAALIETFVR